MEYRWSINGIDILVHAYTISTYTNDTRPGSTNLGRKNTRVIQNDYAVVALLSYCFANTRIHQRRARARDVPDEGRVLRPHEDEEADANELRRRQQHVLVLTTQLLLQVRAPLALVLRAVNQQASRDTRYCARYMYIQCYSIYCQTTP